MAGFGAVRADVYDRVSRSQYYRDNLAGLTAHERHHKLLAELQRGERSQPVITHAHIHSCCCSLTDGVPVLRLKQQIRLQLELRLGQ